MKKSILVILIITGIINITTAQNYILEGTIKDENTGERLTGVNVYVPELEKGTVSDMNGKYELTLDEGEHRVVYSFVGYQRQEKKIDLTSDMVLDIWMDSGGLRLNEVLVTGERTNRNVEDTEMSAVTLDIETIKRIPAFLGEVDVLRTIQLMPGVQSAGDGNTGFFVRGGNADQNLVLLDDAVVFNASHLFNFFSVFNPDAINDVKLYKGGIFPEYGGRLSSVLDINMKTGDKDRYKVNGGLGLISSRLTAEGPIQRGKSSFLVSGRRTYADLFLKLSSDETQRETQLYFYDLNWKTNYVINDKNRVFFSGYFGRDVTMLSDLFGFDWGNTTMTLRWNHLFRENFFSDISFLYSNYQFNITGEVGPADFQWKSFLHNLNVKADFNWLPTEESTLNFGIQSIYHNLDPGTVSATVEGAADTNIDLTLNNGLEHGIYANYEQNLFDNRLSLAVGIRNSIYQVIGPGAQYTYDQSDPLLWEVADTLDLKRGEVYDQFLNLEPRASMRFKINELSSVKASYNRMVQYLQQAQSAQSVAPYDVWFAVSNNIEPQIADQLALGYFRNFSDNMIESSVEIYYKDFKNITDVIDNGDILGNEFVEGELRTGTGWSYGAEFLLQKPSGRINGILGYTWSVAKRKIPGINDGNPYFSPNDRRHDLSLSGSYDYTPEWNIGINFVYATGRAFTLPIGKIYYQGAFAPVYDVRNANRMPDYHRLDLSVTYTPEIRRRDNIRFQSSWNFSVFNVYGRANPISISFAENEERPGIPNSSYFYIPGPIPAVTWNFNF